MNPVFSMELPAKMDNSTASLLFYDAVVNNELDAVKRIVELYKIDLNAKFTEVRKANYKDLCPVHLVAYKGYPRMLQFLLDQKCEASISTSIIKRQAIHYAALKHQMACLRKLLNAGAEVNARDTFGNSPCHYAAEDGNCDILRELISRGADVNMRDITWKTPLMKATRNGKARVTEMLLKAGCDVNIRDKYRDTALHFATRNGSLTILTMLLNAAADVNVQNHWGLTPLMEAVCYNQREAVSRLIARNCDLYRREIKTGDTALHIAVKKNYSVIADMLLSAAGWDRYVYNYNRESLLHDAVIYNRVDIIKLFIFKNFDLDIPGKILPNGTIKTIVQLAIDKGNAEICRLLSDVTCLSLVAEVERLHNRHIGPKKEPERSVKSLKQWCRKYIRKALGYKISDKVETLPIPSTLKDFVLLKELGIEVANNR
jgi:ankyrin repeat protein